MKKVYFALALALVLPLLASTAAAREHRAPAEQYIVLYAEGASPASARLALEAVGARIVRENRKVGVATVLSANPRLVQDVSAQPALAGAAHNAPIGRNAPLLRPKRNVVERLTAAERASARSVSPARAAAPADPLAGLQWGNAMIHATVDGSYATEPGKRGVRVGILDTGIDGSHPDIAPNFDASLSRNFTTDIELVDGPCADEPDQSCNDPANVDEGGHGTHVAGIVGAALNGLGTAGVAPNVTLVNIRAGQDSGFFFLQPTVDALTYAGDNGIDVVNMSYFIDPWLYNCAANPADSPAAQAEQRTIVAATNRALDYAWKRGVTLIGAEGNEHTDLGSPTVDTISPDFPPESAYTRNVDNSCLDMPTEGNNVISIGAVGPSTMKADYSNWGVEQTAVTAPGGWFRDFFGTPRFRTNENLVLSTYPKNVGIEEGTIDANGDITPLGIALGVQKDCKGATCGYYQYLQGTSMAAPHAAGVAALIVSRWGHPDGGRPSGQLTMQPKNVEKALTRTATDHACPDPPLIDYADEGRPPEFNALCTGSAAFNSIWGEGIVDALTAVTKKNP